MDAMQTKPDVSKINALMTAPLAIRISTANAAARPNALITATKMATAMTVISPKEKKKRIGTPMAHAHAGINASQAAITTAHANAKIIA